MLPLVRLRRAALFQGRVELVSKGAGFIKTLTKDDILPLFDWQDNGHPVALRKVDRQYFPNCFLTHVFLRQKQF